MKATKLIMLFMITLLLQGCLEAKQVEETAIIRSRGVDLIDKEGERIIQTTIIPYLFDPKAPEMMNLLVGSGYTIKEARDDAAKQSPYTLSPGKISIEFYGLEAAKAGILPFVNPLIRDARVSDIMQLAVTSETAKELLEFEHENVKVNHTEYLENLIRNEIEMGVLPRNSLEYFTRLGVQVGIDPLLPVVDIVDEKPTLTNVALFKNDQYVGEISLKESFLVTQLRSRVQGTSLEVDVPLEPYRDLISYKGEVTEQDRLYLSLRLDTGKGKIKVVDPATLSFSADVKMKVELLETTIPIDLKTEKTSEDLERDIGKYYVQIYEDLFEQLKEAESDAFGLGRKYLATREGSKTTDKEWREKYKEATMEFNVDVQILNFGTID